MHSQELPADADDAAGRGHLPRAPKKISRPIYRWTYLLLAVAVVLFAAATAYGFYKLRQDSDLAQYNSQAALWLVVSFEREYLKLDNLMHRYQRGDSVLDPEELLIQFDVLWSRVELMREGGHSRPLQLIESFHSVVPKTMQLLRRHEQALFAEVSGGRPLPPEFVSEFRAINDEIHAFMVDTHLNRGWIVEMRENLLRDNRLAIYLTLAGTIVSTLMLFAIVLIQLRDRHGNLKRSMRALAQSESDRAALHAEVARRKQVEAERQRLMLDLEARNEELERYAYTISHDLKSPLYTIQGFTGFLQQDLEQGDTEKLQQDIERITNAVQTMSSLLDDILNLSKIDLVQESARLVALGEIVDDALALLQREIEEQGVQVEIAPDLPQVYASPQRLTEVFQNLIANANKFMGDQPSPRIRIGARQAGDAVICEVRDNGIGIDPEYCDRVFNLFERLDSSTRGTGIGLAIVKRIVERNGGRIRAYSEGPGTGSCFEFTLPARAPRR